MAAYKSRHLLSASEDLVLHHDHPPGDRARLSGIYRCAACGRESVVKDGDTLPNDHSYAVSEGPVRWRVLVVYADHGRNDGRSGRLDHDPDDFAVWIGPCVTRPIDVTTYSA